MYVCVCMYTYIYITTINEKKEAMDLKQSKEKPMGGFRGKGKGGGII